jgi:hypothetical protein
MGISFVEAHSVATVFKSKIYICADEANVQLLYNNLAKYTPQIIQVHVISFI